MLPTFSKCEINVASALFNTSPVLIPICVGLYRRKLSSALSGPVGDLAVSFFFSLSLSKMDKGDFSNGDADGAKIRIADEKTLHRSLETIPDPDDGLSAEERAKIVN